MRFRDIATFVGVDPVGLIVRGISFQQP